MIYEMAAGGTALILGVALFVSTNVDDILLLVAFFANPSLAHRRIVAGQYLGLGVLVGVSLMAAKAALVLPKSYVALLGLLPIAIGVKELIEQRRGRDDQDDDANEAVAPTWGKFHGQTLRIAAVTLANGGDNISVYTPVFAVRPPADVLGILIVFAVMTLLWCAAARWLVSHPTLGAPMRRHASQALPFILIGIGIFVLFGRSGDRPGIPRDEPSGRGIASLEFRVCPQISRSQSRLSRMICPTAVDEAGT